MSNETHTGEHYATEGVECIDALRACLGPDGFRDYCRGTIIKYLWRFGRKDLTRIEAEKVKVYAEWLLANELGEPLRKPERNQP